MQAEIVRGFVVALGAMATLSRGCFKKPGLRVAMSFLPGGTWPRGKIPFVPAPEGDVAMAPENGFATNKCNTRIDCIWNIFIKYDINRRCSIFANGK